jgi:hypothetical protein
MPDHTYQPVPVAAARTVAFHYRKDVVIIFSVDRAFDKTHFTSWGRKEDDKVQAAALTDLVAATLQPGLPREMFEDFRTVDAAERALKIERATELLKWFIHQFEGDSGMGHNHWSQFAEYREALVIVGREKDARDPAP